jgi:rRNA-processing protein FCF1
MRILLFDANVLIDFYDADASIFRLIAKAVGRVHVVLPVFEEVAQISERDARALGISIVDPEREHWETAATSPAGRLSFQDRLCLEVARDRSWTCVTNDGALRKRCQTAQVAVLWGLELLALTVEARGISADAAATLAQTIASNNPTHITARVLKGFLARIGR